MKPSSPLLPPDRHRSRPEPPRSARFDTACRSPLNSWTFKTLLSARCHNRVGEQSAHSSSSCLSDYTIVTPIGSTKYSPLPRPFGNQVVRHFDFPYFPSAIAGTTDSANSYRFCLVTTRNALLHKLPIIDTSVVYSSAYSHNASST